MTRPADTAFVPGLDALAHQTVRRALDAPAAPAAPILVDATAGNGYDTLFLAGCVRAGTVYAFDVQETALAHTRARLDAAFATLPPERCPAVRLILDSHARLARYVPAPVHAALFNLGFLPGSDKTDATRAASTLAALDALLPRFAVGGVLSAHLYTGHPAGQDEAEAVLAWAEALPREPWRVLAVRQHNKRRNREWLVLAEKIR